MARKKLDLGLHLEGVIDLSRFFFQADLVFALRAELQKALHRESGSNHYFWIIYSTHFQKYNVAY